MRNYYLQINEYLQKLVNNVIVVDKKGIVTAGFSLSITDILILKEIGDGNKIKMFQLMESLSLDRNTFKSIINRLVTQDYVSKNKCENDKRAFYLELTDKGRKLFMDILDKEKEMLFSILSDCTFNEEKAILKFLVKLDMIIKEKK